MLIVRARLLLATLWAGSLWTLGYLVAPTLFLALHDNALAGTIVGALLRVEGWLSIACTVLLMLLLRRGPALEAGRHKQLASILIWMLACAAVLMLLQAQMASLREAAGLAGSALGARFGILHGISQLVFLVESVLAGVLVVKIR